MLLLSSQLTAQNPFVCEGQLYLTISPNGGNSKIYEVIINTTGAVDFVPLGNGNTGYKMNALGYRSTDNFMYAINPSTHIMYQIDNTGTASIFTNLNLNPTLSYWGAAIHPDGSQMVFVGSTWGGGSRELAFFDFNTMSVTKQIPLVSATTGNTPNILCTDIAFDPFSGEVYGFDRINGRLLKFNIDNGVVEDNLYPLSPEPDGMGALFFDSFGNLYGYDRKAGSSIANTLFQLDKNDGSINIVTTGPSSSDKDGCACPYTVKLQKTVFPEVTFPCTEVIYAFQLSNASGVPQDGIFFEDQLPTGMTITEITDNPFGGDIISGVGTDQ